MAFNFDLEGELAGLHRRRSKAALDLSNIEEQIFQLETNYLKDTKSYGNISLGYEAYRGQTKKSAGAVFRGDRKMKKLMENGRIFSNTSVSSKKATKGVKVQNKGHKFIPRAVETQTSGLKNTGGKSSEIKAPSVKTSTVQGFRGKKVFVRSRSKSRCRYISTSGARRANPVTILQKKRNHIAGQLTSLSWIQLRQECLKAGLPAMGKKSEMVARLTGWDKAS